MVDGYAVESHVKARRKLARILDADPAIAARMDLRGMSWPPTAGDLEAEPTLSVGQADNLKLEGDGVRVWLSRVASGCVSVETYVRGRWGVAGAYDGRYVSGDPDRQRAGMGASAARRIESELAV